MTKFKDSLLVAQYVCIRAGSSATTIHYFSSYIAVGPVLHPPHVETTGLTILSIQYTVHYILYTAYLIQYTVYYTPLKKLYP